MGIRTPGYKDPSLGPTVLGVEGGIMEANSNNALTSIPMQLNVNISPVFASGINSNVGIPTLRPASWGALSGDAVARNSSDVPRTPHPEGHHILATGPGVMALTAVLSAAGRAQLQRLGSLEDLNALSPEDGMLVSQIIARIRSTPTRA